MLNQTLTASQISNCSTDAKFTKDHLADLVRRIVENNLQATAFFMTEKRFTDFLDNFGMDEFDDVEGVVGVDEDLIEDSGDQRQPCRLPF